MDAELDELEASKRVKSQEIIKLGNNRDETDENKGKLEKKDQEFKDRLKSKQNEKRALDSQERDLKNKQNNELTKYGKAMENLCIDINQNRNR